MTFYLPLESKLLGKVNKLFRKRALEIQWTSLKRTKQDHSVAHLLHNYSDYTRYAFIPAVYMPIPK